MSSVITPRPCSTSRCSGPKSSPTGPTIRTSVKNEEASEKWTAEPPSIRSRLPKGVVTASKAIDPTTVSDIQSGLCGGLHLQRATLHASRRSVIASLGAVRAIQIQSFGGPEVLRLVDLPVPRPEPGEVLIRVDRAGMNFADTHTRTNTYVRKASLPLVPGSEVVGVREHTVERVIAITGTGGYAQYALAPRDLVFPLPEGVDEGTALALLIQGLTAWHLPRTAGR